MAIQNTKDFRTYLKNEFIRRHQKNQKYSLRSFAKFLSISHATLSHILRKTRPLTVKSFFQLAHALKLNQKEIQEYIPQKYKVKSSGLLDIPTLDFEALSMQTFNDISEWYYDAIIELIKIESFNPDPQWIGRSLGISPLKVKKAIRKLIKLGLLEITKDGKWIDKSEFNTTIQYHSTSDSLRKLQTQLLKRGIKALYSAPFEERDHSSVTMAIDPQDLPNVKEKIKRFRRDLSYFVNRKGVQPKNVYHLGVCFYPATQKGEFLDEKK